MRRSIGPGSYLATIALTVTLSFVGLEAYCRWSARFNTYQQNLVRHIISANARDAVLGDSQVGQTSYLEGFEFLGQAGQKPQELLRLVRFLYTFVKPDHVILEMAPQWLGFYHVADPQVILTEEALPPAYSPVRLLIASKYFRGSLRANIADDVVRGIGGVMPSHAAELSAGADVKVLTQEWQTLIATRSDANWAMIEHSKRRILTLHRLAAQNPVSGFEDTAGARELEQAIDFLIERGAKLCLFRTPVTSDYIELSRQLPESRYDAFLDFSRRIATRRGVPFVNFSDLDYVFDDSNFINQDHLTGRSAADIWPVVKRACFGKGVP
jgi:hypothetical protein